MKLSETITVTILAATDALFIPDRDPLASPRHQVISERRSRFPHRGIPWASEKVLPGADAVVRKQIERTLDELVTRGLVNTYQPKGAKTLGAKLTEYGDARARSLAGLPGLAASFPLLERIRTGMQSGESCEFIGRVWVPETRLANVLWGDNEHRKAFVDLEEKLLPALVRGYVVSNCSVYGHCWYSLTEAGEQAIQNRPAEQKDLPARNRAAQGEYYQAIEREVQAMAGTRPEQEREIGEIPMPVSPGPRPQEVAGTDRPGPPETPRGAA